MSMYHPFIFNAELINDDFAPFPPSLHLSSLFFRLTTKGGKLMMELKLVSVAKVGRA